MQYWSNVSHFTLSTGCQTRCRSIEKIIRLSISKDNSPLHEKAIKTIETRKDTDATVTEIAKEMGISLSEYHQILIDSNSSHLFSVDALEEKGDYQLPSSVDKSPFDMLSEKEYQQQLVDSIRSLPEKEQLVMSLYYDEELNFREIGQVLEVSESRVCQIHAQAVLRIRSKMTDWKKEH